MGVIVKSGIWHVNQTASWTISSPTIPAIPLPPPDESVVSTRPSAFLTTDLVE